MSIKLGHSVRAGFDWENGWTDYWHIDREDDRANGNEWSDDVEVYVYFDDEVWPWIVGWCLESVGLMTYLAFNSEREMVAWLEDEGAEHMMSKEDE